MIQWAENQTVEHNSPGCFKVTQAVSPFLKEKHGEFKHLSSQNQDKEQSIKKAMIRGAGTTLKLGGGANVSRGNRRYPKLKTPRIWLTIFLLGTQVHVQKQIRIKMNDFHSPMLGGGARPHSFKVVGASCPHCPPPPRFPRPWQ